MRKEVLAVGCALMVFCGCGKNNAAQHYESGWAAMGKKDYTTAVNEFQQVIDQNSRLAESYRAEGIAYYSEKAYPEAIAAFSRSLNNMDDPDKEFKKDVQFYLAQARMDYGEVDKAIEVYSEILKAGEDEQAFFLRGKAYISMEDYKNAEKDFQRALEGCEDYNLYINIYQIYVDHNKAVDGDAYLKMALELEPQDGEDCYHRGRIYEYEKNYEAARDELKTAMEQGYEDAMLLLGRVYLEMEDPASARSMYQEYLQKSEQGAKAYNGLAMCDIYDGAYDSALENIAQGLKENSKEDEQGLLYNEIVAYEYKRDFATAKEKMVFCGCGKNNAAQHYESGWAAMGKKDYTTAVNEFQQVIDQNSRLAESYRAEGIAYYSEKAYPEAIAAFSRSLNNMDDPDKEFKKDVQFYLAQARMDYGEVDKAIEVYSEILKAGEDEQAFFLRGKAYISMEDYKNAEKDFQRALEGCEDYNLYINIYQIYVDHNKAVDGDAYLKMALELEPQDGEDCYHRGRIYEYEKNYEAARDELKTAMEQGYEDAMLLLGRVYLEMEDPASARSMYQEYLQKSEQGAKAYNGLAMCDIYDGAYDSALENIAQGLKENSKEDEQGLLYNEIVAYEYKRDFATAKEKMKIYLEQYPEDEAALRENEFLSTR